MTSGRAAKVDTSAQINVLHSQKIPAGSEPTVLVMVGGRPMSATTRPLGPICFKWYCIRSSHDVSFVSNYDDNESEVIILVLTNSCHPYVLGFVITNGFLYSTESTRIPSGGLKSDLSEVMKTKIVEY